MFGHLYLISQQSHKSAPTDGWSNLLICIIGPYGCPEYFVNVHYRALGMAGVVC